jgi:hypothetical protein
VIDANASAVESWKLPTLSWIELSVKVTLADASAGKKWLVIGVVERQDADPGPEPLMEQGVPSPEVVEILKDEIVDG